MSIASQNERGGQIAALFVRRPVLAVVVNALIIVAGLAAFLGVEVRELPSVEQPVLTVSTSFPGAAAETVDREITATVEGAVARVQGVTSISSGSSYGNSRVTLALAEGTNLDNATSDVRDATSRLINRFPGRFLFGTDEVAPASQAAYLKVFHQYEPLWNLLEPTTKSKVLRENYERIFDRARRKVRIWERANGRDTAAPGKMLP